jgi:hypothetical protein
MVHRVVLQVKNGDTTEEAARDMMKAIGLSTELRFRKALRPEIVGTLQRQARVAAATERVDDLLHRLAVQYWTGQTGTFHGTNTAGEPYTAAARVARYDPAAETVDLVLDLGGGSSARLECQPKSSFTRFNPHGDDDDGLE